MKLRDIRETEAKEGDKESGEKGRIEENGTWKQAEQHAEREDKKKSDEHQWVKNGMGSVRAPRSAVQEMYESKLRYARAVQV